MIAANSASCVTAAVRCKCPRTPDTDSRTTASVQSVFPKKSHAHCLGVGNLARQLDAQLLHAGDRAATKHAQADPLVQNEHTHCALCCDPLWLASILHHWGGNDAALNNASTPDSRCRPANTKAHIRDHADPDIRTIARTVNGDHTGRHQAVASTSNCRRAGRAGACRGLTMSRPDHGGIADTRHSPMSTTLGTRAQACWHDCGDSPLVLQRHTAGNASVESACRTWDRASRRLLRAGALASSATIKRAAVGCVVARSRFEAGYAQTSATAFLLD